MKKELPNPYIVPKIGGEEQNILVKDPRRFNIYYSIGMNFPVKPCVIIKVLAST